MNYLEFLSTAKVGTRYTAKNGGYLGAILDEREDKIEQIKLKSIKGNLYHFILYNKNNKMIWSTLKWKNYEYGYDSLKYFVESYIENNIILFPN